MNSNTFNTLVWFFFAGFILFIVFFGTRRMIQNNKKKREVALKLAQFQSENEHLTSEKFDALSDNELEQAVVFSVMRKENEDENYFDSLTYGEKVVYGIYLLNNSISRNSGLRTFFNSPACENYIDEIDDYFESLGAMEIAQLIKSAKHFNDVLENGVEDVEENNDYSTYNFSDYTHEYVTLIAGTNFHEKLAQYIRNNKEAFVEKGEIK